MELGVQTVRAPLRNAFVAGHGETVLRELLLVALTDGDGVTGYGEAAPLESYDGVSIDAAREALHSAERVLADSRGAGRADVLARCAEVVTLPQALAAIDLALWDLEGRRQGEPVWRLLRTTAGWPKPEPAASEPGAPQRAAPGRTAPERVGPGPTAPERAAPAQPGTVPVNWTIASADRAGAAREAAQAREQGYATVKVKVAIGDDAGRLAAIRAVAGPAMTIRIDANGAWSPEEASAALRMLEPVGLELCEEPVAGVAAIRRLARTTPVPLALDESASQPGALDQRACALACLKIAGSGGVTGLLAGAARARRSGYEVYLASTLDGPLGIAAALHAAMLLRPSRACGLGTLPLFADRPNPFPARDGAIDMPLGPGLGDGLLDWYSA